MNATVQDARLMQMAAPGGGRAARVAVAAILAYQGLSWLVAVVNPQWDPMTRQLSEYALGRAGWLMTAAFIASGVAYLALVVALRPLLHERAGRIGLGVLGYCAAGSVGVGVFVTDSMTTPMSEISTRGMLHFAFGFSALLLLPVAALLVTRVLARRASGSVERRAMRLLAALPLAGFVAIWVPEVAGLIRTGGWPDRALFLTYTAWVIAVALRSGIIHRAISRTGTTR